MALKVLPAEMASTPQRLERFRRGSEALAALDHPGIVSVFSVEGADGVHFLTMQLVEGRRLDQVIPQGGLPPETLLAHATTLAASVQLLLWRISLAELQIQWTAVGSRRQMPWVAMNWR